MNMFVTQISLILPRVVISWKKWIGRSCFKLLLWSWDPWILQAFNFIAE